jgi:hypothetical protein
MRKTVNYFMASALMAGVLLIASCSKNEADVIDTGSSDTGKSKFVFVVFSDGSGGEASRYIVSTDNVTSGTLSIKGNGIETDAYSFVKQNNKLFGIVYAAQGPTTPFKLNANGELVKAGANVNTEMTGVYGTVNANEYVGGSVTRSLSSPIATLYRFDAENLQIAGRNTVDLSKITGTDEMAVWTGITQVDNKLFAPLYYTPGVTGQSTKYVDSTWIAVFDYPSLKYKRIIRDGRTGFIGNWFGMQGVKQIENGDVYAWSTAGGSGTLKSTKPSAILRIKKGAEEFDQTYFFNVEAAAKTKIARGEYIKDGKFLMTLYATDAIGSVSGGRVKLAIVDVINKTINYVSGVPEHDQMAYNMKVYVDADGKTAYYVMKEDAANGGEHYLYVIDVASGTAKRGIKFQGIADVTSITKLNY